MKLTVSYWPSNELAYSNYQISLNVVNVRLSLRLIWSPGLPFGICFILLIRYYNKLLKMLILYKDQQRYQFLHPWTVIDYYQKLKIWPESLNSRLLIGIWQQEIQVFYLSKWLPFILHFTWAFLSINCQLIFF